MNTMVDINSIMGSFRAAEAEMGRRKREVEEMQVAGAKANMDSRNLLMEQNRVLQQQLAEQTEINQRLENEFEMGAREAVITRRLAYGSLVIGAIGVILAIIALIKDIWG